jgi:hypothetical protein
MRRLALVVVLLLTGCKLANVLPGGSASQRAIESGVVRILNLRGDFDRYVNLHRQYDAAVARGDQASADRLRAAVSAVVDDSQRTRGSYNEQVVRTAKDFTPDTIKLALDAVVARYEADGATALVPLARMFAQQTLDYQGSGAADFDKLHEELLR